MPDATYHPKVYRKQGGSEFVAASGGAITVESGGTLDVQAGATLNLPTGSVARAGLVEDALQIYGIPVPRLQQTTGIPLAASETAGNFNVAVAANVITAQGEVTDNETEVSVCQFQFVLPPEYVAGGDVKVRLPVAIVKTGAAVDNGSTIDVSAYKQSDAGAVGSDICATAAQTFAAVDTWYNKDFTITATGLVAGDVLNIVVTASIIDNEAGGGTLRLNMAPPKVLLDVKG